MLLTKLIPPRSESLKDAVACFNRFLEEPHESKEQKCEMFIYGGRGCLKSSIASGMVMKAVTDARGKAVCIRQSAYALGDSCCAQIEWAANRLGVIIARGYERCRNLRIGEEMRVKFLGVDIGEKMLAENVLFFRPNVVWIDDAEELEESEYNFIIHKLPLAENPIFISTFNPPASRSHWINRLVGERKPNGYGGRWFYNPCYTEVEREWLGESFFTEAEMLRRMNPVAYCHEYIGVPFED